MKTIKPFDISKRAVWEAFKRVEANQGTAGVDEQSIQAFEEALKNNLYKLWNRMASGSYFPSPVRRVDIPKSNGGKRPLGIATVADRIAQTVVKMALEPEMDPYFHQDSYGYRPGKSGIAAVGVARQRCWQYDWTIDLDIRGLVRQRRSRPADACGEETHRLQVDKTVYREMAESTSPTARRVSSP
ncbi:MAG: reverse transcriptase domain-containing protein [Cyanobacteria bacterium J06559_3]